MKMAKSSEADIDMAMTLANVLDDIERGYFPEKFIDLDGDPHAIEIPKHIDTDDADQYARLIEKLRDLLRKGSIFRVIWGMAVVCDPSNECIDPDADTIEHHPKRQQLEKQRDDLLAACQGLLKAHRVTVARPPKTVEEAESQLDVIRNAVAAAEAAIASVNADQFRDATKMIDDTSAPAIVFYPAGSLGEPVESEGGEA